MVREHKRAFANDRLLLPRTPFPPNHLPKKGGNFFVATYWKRVCGLQETSWLKMISLLFSFILGSVFCTTMFLVELRALNPCISLVLFRSHFVSVSVSKLLELHQGGDASTVAGKNAEGVVIERPDGYEPAVLESV